MSVFTVDMDPAPEPPSPAVETIALEPTTTPPRRNRDDSSVGYKRAGREMALQFLYQVDLGGGALNERELNLFWQGIEDDSPELLNANYRRSKKFANAVINGVVERISEIDGLIGKFSLRWDLKRISAVDRNILRVAIFEMIARMEIPPVVSINEAIEISKYFSTDKSPNFINGILNSVKDTLDRPAREGKPPS